MRLAAPGCLAETCTDSPSNIWIENSSRNSNKSLLGRNYFSMRFKGAESRFGRLFQGFVVSVTVQFEPGQSTTSSSASKKPPQGFPVKASCSDVFYPGGMTNSRIYCCVSNSNRQQRRDHPFCQLDRCCQERTSLH